MSSQAKAKSPKSHSIQQPIPPNMGQDSVFLVRSDYLESFDDEPWVDVGSQFLEDPDNEEADWVTVILPEEMNKTHSDEDIMKYVLHNIRIRRAVVSQVALHNMGVTCISILIPVSTVDTATILICAEADGNRWLEMISNGMATLRREVIFGRR